MKKHIIILFIVSIHSLSAQKVLDTIYANDQKNVALFFPNPIRHGITGADNFVFTYNREKQQYFGLLQAMPGDESNLLVINTEGSVYSYIIQYKKELSQLNYFIAESGRIGTEKPMQEKSTLGIAKKEKVMDASARHQQFCKYLLRKPRRIVGIKKNKYSIGFHVENIVFHRDALYVVLQVENKSSLDYAINYLNFTIQTRKKGKKKSLQSNYQQPVFVYNMPENIDRRTSKRLVYVLPKFSISNDRLVVVALNEKGGERNMELKISHKRINNPN